MTNHHETSLGDTNCVTAVLRKLCHLVPWKSDGPIKKGTILAGAWFPSFNHLFSQTLLFLKKTLFPSQILLWIWKTKHFFDPSFKIFIYFFQPSFKLLLSLFWASFNLLSCPFVLYSLKPPPFKKHCFVCRILRFLD